MLIPAALLFAASLSAHCDGLDGPVIKAAERALQTGDVDHVLIWVQKHDEPAVRSAFQHTVEVRKLGPEARELADRYFFETLVRVHRAGEGAPYTGLKPAGRDLGPAIPAADQAVETGDGAALVKLLTGAAHHGLEERLATISARKSFKSTEVEAGRAYVRAYVELLHYAEGLYEAAANPAGGTAAHEH